MESFVTLLAYLLVVVGIILIGMGIVRSIEANKESDRIYATDYDMDGFETWCISETKAVMKLCGSGVFAIYVGCAALMVLFG